MSSQHQQRFLVGRDACRVGIAPSVVRPRTAARYPETTRGIAPYKILGGFTLVEMLFTLAISSFLLTGIMTSYVFSLKGFRRLANYNEMQADGRQSLDWFARDVRASMAVSSCISNQVVMLIPKVINSSGVVTSTNIVTHQMTSRWWTRTDGTGVVKQLSTNVNTLTFSLYDQAGSVTTSAASAVSVQVDAFLSKTVQSTTQSSDFLSSRFRMRNTP